MGWMGVWAVSLLVYFVDFEWCLAGLIYVILVCMVIVFVLVTLLSSLDYY